MPSVFTVVLGIVVVRGDAPRSRVRVWALYSVLGTVYTTAHPFFPP